MTPDGEYHSTEKIKLAHKETECLSNPGILSNIKKCNYHSIVNCTLKTQNRITHVDALERLGVSTKGGTSTFFPIRFVPNEKINKLDKLQVAFDALVLFSVSDTMPLFGKIMYGSQLKTTKVNLSSLLTTWNPLLLPQQLRSSQPVRASL